MKLSNKTKIVLAILLSFVICNSSFVIPSKAAPSLPSQIAVGILYNSNASKLITINSGYITDASGNVLGSPITTATTISIEPDAVGGGIAAKINGQTVAVALNALLIYPDNNIFSLGTSKYPGYVKAVQAAGYINIVDVVGMDDYVTNVIPSEIGASSPIEALKAQAVCARNYAAFNMGKHSAQGFDVCNTTDCQVYAPISANPNPNVAAAVAATSGVMMTYNGAIIDAVFAASTADGSGSGWTEDAKNVWGSDVPYLKAVSSTEKKNSGWTYTLTQADANSKLSSYNLGTIQDIKITSASAHGAATAVQVIGSNSTKTFTLQSCRTFLSGGVLRSQAYTITKNVGSSVGDAVSGVVVQSSSGKSTLSGTVSVLTSSGTLSALNLIGAIAQDKNGKSTLVATGGSSSNTSVSWTFTGRGWGHLVGMSQEGAITMANNGSTYQQILTHYYTGIKITNN